MTFHDKIYKVIIQSSSIKIQYRFIGTDTLFNLVLRGIHPYTCYIASACFLCKMSYLFDARVD